MQRLKSSNFTKKGGRERQIQRAGRLVDVSFNFEFVRKLGWGPTATAALFGGAKADED